MNVELSIDIDDAENAALSPCHSAIWNIDCQYNNSNMPDALFNLVLWDKSMRITAYGINA